MEKIINLIKHLQESARSAPDIYLEISLVYSILIFIFLLAALIRKSRGAYIFAVFLAIGLTGVFSAVRLIKIQPEKKPEVLLPPSIPVKEYFSFEVKGKEADEAIQLFAEKVFDSALKIKELGFNKLPPYQKEIISNRLISVAEIRIRETPEGTILEGKVEKDAFYNFLSELGYEREGKFTVMEILNPEEFGISPEESEFLVEGIKRTSVFFLDNKLFTNLKHLRDELTGLELKSGIVIAEVGGTSTYITIKLKKK